jgi:ATP-binding cassette subfamily C protein
LKSAEGFHELVGENGVRISAGERQRIGIARALFDAPSLIVLDEPTANLDSISETQVWKALENIKGRATILIISHRDTPESVYDSKLEFEKL